MTVSSRPHPACGPGRGSGSVYNTSNTDWGNLSAQTTVAEISSTVKSLADQVVTALRGFEPGQSCTPAAPPQPHELVAEQTQNLAAQLPAFSGITGASYHKLPNPLSTIIQQLPVVDGLDVDGLMSF